MPKNKGKFVSFLSGKAKWFTLFCFLLFSGKGGKNYKKGKKSNEGEGTRRELIFKEDGQG